MAASCSMIALQEAPIGAFCNTIMLHKATDCLNSNNMYIFQSLVSEFLLQHFSTNKQIPRPLFSHLLRGLLSSSPSPSPRSLRSSSSPSWPSESFLSPRWGLPRPLPRPRPRPRPANLPPYLLRYLRYSRTRITQGCGDYFYKSESLKIQLKFALLVILTCKNNPHNIDKTAER